VQKCSFIFEKIQTLKKKKKLKIGDEKKLPILLGSCRCLFDGTPEEVSSRGGEEV
jgi:hypothetical protein